MDLPIELNPSRDGRLSGGAFLRDSDTYVFNLHSSFLLQLSLNGLPSMRRKKSNRTILSTKNNGNTFDEYIIHAYHAPDAWGAW